ncbi:MAG: ATP-binding protein [Calditrichaeota bacterium]|nr:MAG: ATP-binding protein [Calditrichota bacterium]
MNELILIQKIDPSVVRLSPNKGVGDKALADALFAELVQFERLNIRHLIIDLHHVKQFSPDFIVLLLEMTCRCRRNDVRIEFENIQPDALEDLLTFNPKRYLLSERPHPLKDAQTSAPMSYASKERTRTQPLEWERQVKRLELPYDESQLYQATDFVSKEAQDIGFSMNEISRMKIAVYEACLNAIQYTRMARPQSKVLLEVERLLDGIQINVYDFGKGFDAEQTKEFDITEAATQRRTGGMGLHIIRRAMDQVDYFQDAMNGNRLIMTKRLK